MSDKVTLSNEELIERCDKWIVDLCKDRKNWTLSVPVQFNRDPDTLFTELIRRFKAALHPSESAGVKPPCFQVKANTGEIHQVKKYIIDTNGSESVWCDTWYGHHRIGRDCEWVGAGVKGAVWVYTSDGLPKKEANVLCEYFSGDYGRQEYHGPEDWWKRNVKRWLNESPAAAGDGKEGAIKLFQRILNQANHARNTSGIDRLPAIKRLAKQGIEIFDPNNKALED